MNPQTSNTSLYQETPSVILDQLDRFHLALQTAQAKSPSPPTGMDTSTSTLTQTVYSGPENATRYIRLLKALEKLENYCPDLTSVKTSAMAAVEESSEFLQAMNELIEELGEASSRTTSKMKAKRKRHTDPPVFTTEDNQAISELYGAIGECNEMLQEYRDYIEETTKRASDGDRFESDSPSAREISRSQSWKT